MNQFLAKKCRPSLSSEDRIAPSVVEEYLQQLEGWQLSPDRLMITRRFSFKNFKQTMFFINALAFVCEKEGHHPDARFSFGYCEVSFTTHDSGGLSLNDFICAAKLNQLVSN